MGFFAYAGSKLRKCRKHAIGYTSGRGQGTMRTVRLTEDEIAEMLGKLPEWTRKGQTISRTYQFASFAAAIMFINQVAEVAERVDHHPDIDIRYDKVTLALTTHSHKALTSKDVYVAGFCDDFASEARP